MTNPYLATSHNWYVHELETLFPQGKTIKASRGYNYKVDSLLINMDKWPEKAVIVVGIEFLITISKAGNEVEIYSVHHNGSKFLIDGAANQACELMLKRNLHDLCRHYFKGC